jgi:hypothetical protein
MKPSLKLKEYSNIYTLAASSSLFIFFEYKQEQHFSHANIYIYSSFIFKNHHLLQD